MTAADADRERFPVVPDPRPDDVPWPPLAWPPPADVRLSGRVVDLVPAVPRRDAAALFQLLDDDQVWAHVAGRPASPQGYVERLEGQLAAGFFPWIVRLRVPHAGLPPGALVGTSSYLDVSVGDARLEIGATAYLPAVWGTAVNPDAKLALLSYAFDVLGAGRVQVKTDVRNTRSQQAIARLGARYEGTLRRYQRRTDGTVRDTVMFAVIAEDWPEVRAALAQRVAGAAATECSTDGARARPPS